MLKKVLLLSLFVLIIVVLFSFKGTIQENGFSVKFKLLNHSASVNSPIQFRCIVTFANTNHTTIKIDPKLQYGWDGSDPFTIQAFDLNNNEIDIAADKNADIDYLLHLPLIDFKIGDCIIDTINNESVYRFTKKGVYKLRLIFEPENLYTEGKEISGNFSYSNWDTLTIK